STVGAGRLGTPTATVRAHVAELTMNAYVFDQAWDAERARLAGLELGLDPGTIRHLETLGVRAGWTCWEIGGGGGSIAAWLCERVGDAGRVLATDLETSFLENSLMRTSRFAGTT